MKESVMSSFELSVRVLTIACLGLTLATRLPAATLEPTRNSAAASPDYAAPEFTVPDGFVVDLAGGPPLVNHPIMAGFDDRGRLFVAESAGLNLKNTELDEQLPNYIICLEDTDGDGYFDKSTRFAENMTFPQGALWHDGALYVCSPPGVWRLEDTDGDGVADKREQIVTGLTYTGNAADIHGPFLHPNGRLYWCHGRKGHEVHQPDGTLVSSGKGARIWSSRFDGSDIRVHAGGGMDNPVEVTFTPEGDILGDVNLFYGRPRGDVLVHWLHGGAYPRHDMEAVVAEFPRTGDLLKEVHNFGHVAVSGLTRYQSAGFGASYTGNLFVTFFNTHKVGRVALTRQTSTFTADPQEFLEAHSNDFHCTDVLEDADGSLLVLDTGGWFRIGCPTSQIAKPELLGAIYRIRKTGAQAPVDPRGLKLDWQGSTPAQLAALLDDERFAVRDRAITELAKRAAKEVLPALRTVLKGRKNDLARLNAVWTLTRLESRPADALIRRSLDDDNFEVRYAACQAVGLHKDADSVGELIERLRVDFPAVRREAATALGEIGDAGAVPAILGALHQPDDRELEHALIYALIEIGNPAAVENGLSSESPSLKRCALIALDQMPGGNLRPDRVMPLLDSKYEEVLATVGDIIAHRPEWAEPAARYLRGWFDEKLITDRRLGVLGTVGPRVLNNDAGRALITRMFELAQEEPHTFRLPAGLLSLSHGLTLDPAWQPYLLTGLESKDDFNIGIAIDAIKALGASTFDEELKAVGHNDALPPLLRVKAMATISGKSGQLDDDSFQLLIDQLAPSKPVKSRGEASRLVGEASLSQPQLLKLAEVAAKAGPLEWPTLVTAFTRTRDQEVGLQLVKSIAASPGSASVAPTELRRMLNRYPAAVQQAANPILDELIERSEQQASHLEELSHSLPAGDAKRGSAIFTSAKALCSNCHRIDGQGGQVGPDLSRIGRIRTSRDLLEAVVYPSASLARDFEAYSIDLKDGEGYTGVILRDGSDSLQLAVASGEPVILYRKDIASIRPSALSLMPQGFDQALSPQELADLVAYLQSRQ